MRSHISAASATSAMDRQDWLVVTSMLFVLLATRMVWIAYNPDSTLYWEEDYRWVAAGEILTGPRLPFFDYQADNYQGGSLVLIALTTGLFAVFGQSLMVLKLSSLAFASATLVALYTLARLYFGRRVAWLAGAGYLVGPPLVAYSALIPMGSHSESALFSLVQISCFLGILSRRWHTPAGWAVLGFVSGLGLWFCYTSGISLAACGLAWLMLEGFPKPRLLLAAVGGSLLGLIPWFVYNYQNGLVGTLRLLEIFGGGDPIDAWAPQAPLDKFLALILRDLPNGMIDPFGDLAQPALTVGFELAFYLPVSVAVAAGLGRVWRGLRSGQRQLPPEPSADDERNRCELVFFVYGVVFLAAYLGSSFAVNPEHKAHAYRLFLPLVILMSIPAAISATRALEADRLVRGAAIAGLCFSFASSAAGSIGLALRSIEPQLANDVGQHVDRGSIVRGVLLHRKFEADLGPAFIEARRIADPRNRFRSFQGIGWGIEYRYEGSGDLESLVSHVDPLKASERVAVLAGLRWASLTRVAELVEERARGELDERRRAQLARLRALQPKLDARWQRIPARYKGVDFIVD